VGRRGQVHRLAGMTYEGVIHDTPRGTFPTQGAVFTNGSLPGHLKTAGKEGNSP